MSSIISLKSLMLFIAICGVFFASLFTTFCNTKKNLILLTSIVLVLTMIIFLTLNSGLSVLIQLIFIGAMLYSIKHANKNNIEKCENYNLLNFKFYFKFFILGLFFTSLLYILVVSYSITNPQNILISNIENISPLNVIFSTLHNIFYENFFIIIILILIALCIFAGAMANRKNGNNE